VLEKVDQSARARVFGCQGIDRRTGGLAVLSTGIHEALEHDQPWRVLSEGARRQHKRGEAEKRERPSRSHRCTSHLISQQRRRTRKRGRRGRCVRPYFDGGAGGTGGGTWLRIGGTDLR